MIAFCGSHTMAAIIALLLLTISFFVLVVTKKIDSKKLKIFGYVLTSLLWTATIFVLIGHFYCMKMHGSKMMQDKGFHQMMPKK